MVLRLKTRESRSLPGLPRCDETYSIEISSFRRHADGPSRFRWPLLRPGTPATIIIAGNRDGDAGGSSPVARQAHNLKVIGSNPIPATKHYRASFGRPDFFL